MNIKKKLNRYVEELQIPSEQEVLPEGTQSAQQNKKTGKTVYWRYGLGFAGTAAACVVAGTLLYVKPWEQDKNVNHILGEVPVENEDSVGDGKTPEIITEGVKTEGTSGAASDSTGTSDAAEGSASETGTFRDGEIGAAGSSTNGGSGFWDSITGFFSGEEYDEEEMAGAAGEWADEAPAVMVPEESILPDAAASDDEDAYNGLDIDGEFETIAPQEAAAGTLTGGEIRDLKNWDHWLRTLSSTALAQWNMALNKRMVVYIHDGDTPLNDIHVRLMEGDTVLYEAVTDVTGYAYLFAQCRADGEERTPTQVQVEAQDGAWQSYEYSSNYTTQAMDISLQQQSPEVQVDLMFVVDTTGSMGDELEYLKVELQDVIERVEKETGAPIRTSVNFYRDEGDEYVVRYYDFRDDAAEAAALVGEQEANGGGDEPEAVHTALDNALHEHNWSQDSTVKLLFLVLDAPPHQEYAQEILELTEEAAAMGVRIIPVAASGASENTQQLLRGMAVMTGGTFIFLDDNSGVGYGHTVTEKQEEYSSEYLNAMMIRIIGEYCGVNIELSEVEAPTVEETTAFTQ
jgi:hypothetical protein